MTGSWAWLLLLCSAQVKCEAQPDAAIKCSKKPTPQKDDDGGNKHLYVPVLRRVLHVLVLHVSFKGSVGGSMRVLLFGRVSSVAGR